MNAHHKANKTEKKSGFSQMKIHSLITKCKFKIAEWGRRQWSNPSLTKAVLFLKSQEDYSQSVLTICMKNNQEQTQTPQRGVLDEIKDPKALPVVIK